LKDYLTRHPEMDVKCSKHASLEFLTTGDTKFFDERGTKFFGKEIRSQHLQLS
jgi:glutamate racemase